MVRSIRKLEGLKIEPMREGHHKIIKEPANWDDFFEATCGDYIDRVRRVGKWIVIYLGGRNPGTLVIHNSMYGSIRVYDLSIDELTYDPHDRIYFVLHPVGDDEANCTHVIVYRDIRCWGRIYFIERGKPLPMLEKLGADALTITAEEYKANFSRYPMKSVGDLLMRQDLVAGIGNIYRSEILYFARISPFRLVQDMDSKDWVNLSVCTQSILNAAIDVGGSSISNYERPDGTLGGAQLHHLVYGRQGNSCALSDCGPIKVEKVADRKVFYCPVCQK
jgi:formamidopyrimidine-DNA glycosylase